MMLPTKYVKTQDLQGCLEWLQQNPITVQYELAEPIISYPRIVSNTQEREVGVKLPNGICDTYNPSTGITVKRVGKVVLDGSEDWQVAGEKPFMYMLLQSRSIYHVCDKLPAMTNVVSTSTDLGTVIINPNTSACLLRVRTKEILNGQSIADFKTYLASNPITVYYELANPIVTTDIVLPNGVHDEYNPLTGLYTKRVGYIELDGGETNLNYRVHSNGYLLVDITDIKMTSLQTQPTNSILSNVSVRSVDDVYSNTNITTTSIALHHQAKSLMIRVVNSSTTVTTIDGYKTYLSQNPIKVWYELATPITYQLTPYFGLPMPYAYKDGYLIMDSAYDGQTLPPEITYQLTINRTGQITQNNIKLKEHTDRLSNLEYMLIEATLDSIFDREMQNFELELMNIELPSLDE